MIHSTAVIDKSAVIGQNVEIGPYAVIGEDVIIGDGTIIGAHATIECARIGQNCKIFSHASIGAAPQDLKYAGEKTIAIIGDGTTIREFATVNRGTSASGQTVVGKNCLIMTCAHVAHDCIVGDNCIIANCCAIAGHVEVGDGVVMGGLTAVHQFVKIGKNVITGGGSMIGMDIIPYTQAQGDRASLFGLNLVGLKRKRVPIAEIENIKHAYKILFLSHLTLNDAVAKVEEELSSSMYVKDIIDFIKKSQRGLCRPK
ncbi:MAG: acyl-ACP--UDP-N-acetylglucosamine O-acyltransferase [Elusimicrobia bacterium]|nr:acyl-ACP--UDP-N-acetylglucosamine O-acyltransferase [Elusimicrobiota bacterium]